MKLTPQEDSFYKGYIKIISFFNKMAEKSDTLELSELSFDELNLNENLLRGIYSYGFEKPSMIQHKAVPVVTSGKDVIAQAQSGTGKTGAFSIGSLNRVDETLKESQILILSPTRELAEQTFTVMKELSAYTNISLVNFIHINL